MNKLKSHFTFTIKQRNGIFLLLLIIVALQCVYFFVNFSSEDMPVSQTDFALFQKEMDSLRRVAAEKRKPKIYPFNPNFITDYKGYKLGMTNKEIDRLLQFRKQNKWVNSKKQFQQVTQVSDSLLNKIAPYFKFPVWVTNPKPKTNYNSFNQNKEPKPFALKADLNTATASQLQKVYGIGAAYSKRIIAYREKQQGFVADVELQEVYGLSPEVIERIKNQFTVKTAKAVRKINLNTATRDQLVTIQYIDYEIAHHIIEHRILVERFNTLDDLTKVKSFPVNKIEIIKLYLTLN